MTNCVLCGERVMGRPYVTTEGEMCPDASGCRRRAYHKFVRPLEGTDPGCNCGSNMKGWHTFSCAARQVAAS